ncbi:serine hydrolase-like protein [Betta splendens]|uniref:Serine hydrolase-like protein n=1 Tax=Betta splendens TaxID=158456 RepID=A0A9W2XR81_BETSP|nr:serine hydrolase-like protein [Betta splendens]
MAGLARVLQDRCPCWFSNPSLEKPSDTPERELENQQGGGPRWNQFETTGSQQHRHGKEMYAITALLHPYVASTVSNFILTNVGRLHVTQSSAHKGALANQLCQVCCAGAKSGGRVKVKEQPATSGRLCLCPFLILIPTGPAPKRTLTDAPCPVSELRVPVPWGEIRGRVWGPDHGRPVLCLHSWADNCGSFNTLIPLLPRECRYVAVDIPGHGRSSYRPPGVFYTFPAYVADVCMLVDGLRWTRFSIIGHSMGGNIAALFSALHPEMVEAVVLLDAYGYIPMHPKEIPQYMRQGIKEMLQHEKQTEQKQKVYSYEKAVERMLAANPNMSLQSVENLLDRGLVQVEGGFVFSRDFKLNFKNIFRTNFTLCLEIQSRIQAPVLLILADQGFVLTYSKSNQQKLISPVVKGWRDRNHTVVTVPGDHHIHLNRPEVVAPHVSDFLLNSVLTEQVPNAGL